MSPHNAKMSDTILDRASAVIRSEGVVAAPTDTLVGLLALASSSRAVRKVLAIKGPAREAPLPVLLPDRSLVLSVASRFPGVAEDLADKLWPGPLTIVLPLRPGSVAPEVSAGGNTIGVRVPGPSPALELLRNLNVALTGTSANLSGEPPTEKTTELDGRIVSAVDLVLPGEGKTGAASTIIDATGESLKVLRAGPGLELLDF